MNAAEIRTALAEWDGWIRDSKLDFKIGFDDEYQKVYSRNERACKESDLPNYPNDLNAVRLAESKLSRCERIAYAERLSNRISDQETVMPYYEKIFLIKNLGADICSEELLRTLGKWRDA